MHENRATGCELRFRHTARQGTSSMRAMHHNPRSLAENLSRSNTGYHMLWVVLTSLRHMVWHKHQVALFGHASRPMPPDPSQ